MIGEILKKLKVKDLLAASKVCKYWRDISIPIIADTAWVLIHSMDQAMEKLRNFSFGYRNWKFVVSFLTFKRRALNHFIYIITVPIYGEAID